MDSQTLSGLHDQHHGLDPRTSHATEGSFRDLEFVSSTDRKAARQMTLCRNFPGTAPTTSVGARGGKFHPEKPIVAAAVIANCSRHSPMLATGTSTFCKKVLLMCCTGPRSRICLDRRGIGLKNVDK